MHDFEGRIADWRARLLTSIRDCDAVEELEGHLRELLAREASAGRAADEAWRVAVERLGDRGELAREFDKVHGRAWFDSAVWWSTITLLAFVLAGLLMPMIAGVRDDRLSEILVVHIASIAIGYTLTIAIGVVGLHYALRAVVARRANSVLCRKLPATVSLLAVAAIPLTVLGIILGAIWSAEHRESAWSWDIREVSAVFVVLLQLSVAWAAWSGIPVRLRMALASLACGIALCAWFSPALFQLNSYGFGPALALVIVHAIAILFMMTGVFVAIRPRWQRA